jgi:predicted amidohydrolase YtcJ
MKNYFLSIVGTLCLCCLLSCNGGTSSQNGGHTLYYNGNILPMSDLTKDSLPKSDYAEALVVDNSTGKIAFVGKKSEAKQQFPDAKEFNLNQQTLVPGFVDGHAHFQGFGSQAITANLLAAPDGDCKNFKDIQAKLKAWDTPENREKTQGWILGMGFDDSVLDEKLFPTKATLDSVSKTVPVAILHISGHFCVLNSEALKRQGIDSTMADPAGGTIRRMPNSREPNGVLEELAAFPTIFKYFNPDSAHADVYLEAAQNLAVKYGYTTAHEGRATDNHLQLANFAAQNKFKLDVVSYIDYDSDHFMRTKWYTPDHTYQNRYRIGGLKLTLDGSPQGRTAWRSKPYWDPETGKVTNYKGYGTLDDRSVKFIIEKAFKNKWQLLAHCNGDSAIDQYITCMRAVTEKYPVRYKVDNDTVLKERRNVLIHGQLIRLEQLDSLKKYDIVASFFPMHTYYWGDWYKKILEKDAYLKISPTRSAWNKGLLVTSHTDAPVALPNLMMILHTTVNRISRSGMDVGAATESLTPYQALLCITHLGAKQHFEEKTKGMLVKDRLADMVILDKNPLDPQFKTTLKDIKVMQTFKEGKSVFINAQPK